MFRGLMLSILALASTAAAQSPPPIVYPAGAYTVTMPGPTTITYTAASVTFSWGAIPVPVPVPVPVPPAPVPIVVPVPVLTGHVWALAIYDPDVVLPNSQQAILTSSTIQAFSLLQDVDFQPHATTDTAISSWMPKLTLKPPVLLFVQKGSPAAYQVALPQSEADTLSLVSQVRGK